MKMKNSREIEQVNLNIYGDTRNAGVEAGNIPGIRCDLNNFVCDLLVCGLVDRPAVLVARGNISLDRCTDPEICGKLQGVLSPFSSSRMLQDVAHPGDRKTTTNTFDEVPFSRWESLFSFREAQPWILL
jgi:hypothetical protein